ncbi:MAG TPA: DUF1223 domain-containing protein [Terracidiphilus sp.]|nr:DUF1223 domain-containing protein [Terracidiphilus sp.]
MTAGAIALLAVLAAAQTAGPAGTPQPAGARTPVLVELFTSEGCSDCPPADALLGQLDATQFVPGAEAIVLSEHVTYWNHDGWRDPFSLDEMTFRQQEYVQRFGLNSSYTPQMVIDGAAQVVGNDTRAVAQAIAHAAETPKLQMTVSDAHWAGRTVQFSVHAPADSNGDLFAVLAENATHSEVKRGENAGRTLHHVAVVRVLKDFGAKAADGRPLELPAGFHTEGTAPGDPIRLVVFLTNRKSGHVEAVAEEMLAPPSAGSPGPAPMQSSAR